MQLKFVITILLILSRSVLLAQHQVPGSSFYPSFDEQRSFHAEYTILQKIGAGTYGSVYLCENQQGELVAAKHYTIPDKQIRELLKLSEISVKEIIRQLAQKEWQIGQLADHPNIVKVHDVIFEDSTAYVIMDYIEGHSAATFTEYSTVERLTLMQQFLSAAKHLFLRNIALDDLWSENIIISEGNHLTLIDLAGFEIIDQDADMPVSHYLEMIEKMLISLGGDVGEYAVIDNESLISSKLKKKIISTAHVRKIVKWIDALQESLEPDLLPL